MNTKMIVDATIPLPRDAFPRRADVPAAVIQEIDLDAYVRPWNEIDEAVLTQHDVPAIAVESH
jgi:hypothetical protein